jgi:cell division protein FtsQ
LAVVVGALAVALAVLFALARSDVFAIQSVEVVGAKGVGAARVRSVAAIPPGTNLLRVDTSEIERRLKRDARIADVDVGRDFPHSLVIKVVERTPVALLDLGDTFWVLDGDGWVLEKASLEATTSLVVIRDIAGVKPSAGRRLTTKTLANSLAVLAGLGPELRKQVRAVSASTVDETAAITRGGVEIRFGSSDQIARKDVVARRILKEQAGRVVFIDVRSVDRPVWRGLED